MFKPTHVAGPLDNLVLQAEDDRRDEGIGDQADEDDRQRQQEEPRHPPIAPKQPLGGRACRRRFRTLPE